MGSLPKNSLKRGEHAGHSDLRDYNAGGGGGYLSDIYVWRMHAGTSIIRSGIDTCWCKMGQFHVGETGAF